MNPPPQVDRLSDLVGKHARFGGVRVSVAAVVSVAFPMNVPGVTGGTVGYLSVADAGGQTSIVPRSALAVEL